MLYATTKDIHELHAKLARQDQAIRTLAWWLHQAQTGLGIQDVRGIEDILDGKRAEASSE